MEKTGSTRTARSARYPHRPASTHETGIGISDAAATRTVTLSTRPCLAPERCSPSRIGTGSFPRFRTTSWGTTPPPSSPTSSVPDAIASSARR